MIDQIIQQKLRTKYNPDGSLLRLAQLRMLEILVDFDKICKEHNLKYWLSSGTLIGAVRHGGFIPWDDDVDVDMMEEDYNQLLQILPKVLPDKYIVQNRSTDPNFINNFTKIRDKNSVIVEEQSMTTRYINNGLFIDIFPLSRVRRPLHRFCGTMHLFCYYLSCGNAIFHKLSLWLSNFMYAFIIPICRVLTTNSASNYVYHTYGSHYYMGRDVNDLFPLIEVEYEGYRFPAPRDYDAYLTKLFGDYMKLPSDIHTHIKEGGIIIKPSR